MASTQTNTDPVQLLTDRVDELERRAAKAPNSDALCLVVYSGEQDRLLAAFTMATGAAASGMQVNLFFTFWATPALRRPGTNGANKSPMERMLGWMLPGGLRGRRLSKLDFGGVGRAMMKRRMASMGIAGLPELVEIAGQLGVQITVCEMSMSLLGIAKEDLIDFPNIEIAGVASFLDEASRSATTLFI